jgi:hypothetical protein
MLKVRFNPFNRYFEIVEDEAKVEFLRVWHKFDNEKDAEKCKLIMEKNTKLKKFLKDAIEA